MALPLTGQIGIKAIAQELGNAIGTSGYSTTSLTNSLYGTAGLTLGQNSSVDDGFLTINTPFTVYFNGTGYNTVYVGSNSYMTFGGGSNAYFSLSNTNPPLPAIMISAADNSYQRVYYGSINSGTTFVVRYEGTASTSGTVGSPNIVWEIHFNNSNQNIDIHIGINNRGASGIGGLKTSNAWIIQPTQLTSANNSIRATLSTGITNVSLRGLEIGSYGAINQNSTYKPNGLSPYKISEWRGYNHNATAPTTTTTTQAPTTTTTTQAPVTTYTVTVFASTQATFGNSVRLWYKFGSGGTWTLNGGFTAAPCPSSTTRTISNVPSGTVLYIGMTNSVNTNIRFNAQLTPVCGGGVFNTYCGITNNPAFTINGNTTIYSAVANSGGFINC
jgi:hypothetical protein